MPHDLMPSSVVSPYVNYALIYKIELVRHKCTCEWLVLHSEVYWSLCGVQARFQRPTNSTQCCFLLGFKHRRARCPAAQIKENKDKIKLNNQLPYLVGNVVEVLDVQPEDDEEEDGAAVSTRALASAFHVLECRCSPDFR